MADTLRELRTDHRNMALLLKLMDRQLGAMGAMESTDFDLMHDIMDYMSRYPDFAHHPKEDLMLLRLKALAPSAESMAARLEREHPALAEKGTALLDMLRQVIDGAMVERAALEQKGRDYVDFLRQHMQFEDQQVFPLAEATLGDEDWAIVAEAFEAQKDPIFGPIVADEYQSLYAYIRQESED